MSKPLILNRRAMLEAVSNAFPPKPGGTPKPNPMPGGQPPPPAQPGALPADPNAPPGAAPAAPDPASGMLASVKATVKMLEEDKPRNPTSKPKEHPPATDEADMEPVLGADGKPIVNRVFVWSWLERQAAR